MENLYVEFYYLRKGNKQYCIEVFSVTFCHTELYELGNYFAQRLSYCPFKARATSLSFLSEFSGFHFMKMNKKNRRDL